MAFHKNLSKCSLYESEATIGPGSMMEEDDTESCYFEAFHMFTTKKPTISVNDLLYAMRTAGANPTESELQVDSRQWLRFNKMVKLLFLVQVNLHLIYSQIFRNSGLN